VLRYYKGLHILLDAVANTDYPVVIVGAGPIEQELKDHAERLGLKNVMFVGAVDELDKVALLKLCYAWPSPRTCARKPSASRCWKGRCTASR
jgi:glycosyltransferase involved in cell wall biosynthesis